MLFLNPHLINLDAYLLVLFGWLQIFFSVDGLRQRLSVTEVKNRADHLRAHEQSELQVQHISGSFDKLYSGK